MQVWVVGGSVVVVAKGGEAAGEWGEVEEGRDWSE